MIIFLQVTGCYLYFAIRLSAIRLEMREQLRHLPAEQLTLFTLTPEEFKQARVEDHEIKVNGKMYDIARVEVQDNLIQVYALHDEAEDNLLSFLSELVNRSTNDKKPIPDQLINLLALEFLLEKNSLPANCWQTINHESAYRAKSSSTFYTNETPPPRG